MIAIPNTDKPKTCIECFLQDECEYNKDTYWIHEERPHNCPLIDIVECWECEYYQGHEEYCEIDHFAREYGFCYSGKRRKDEN